MLEEVKVEEEPGEAEEVPVEAEEEVPVEAEEVPVEEKPNDAKADDLNEPEQSAKRRKVGNRLAGA